MQQKGFCQFKDKCHFDHDVEVIGTAKNAKSMSWTKEQPVDQAKSPDKPSAAKPKMQSLFGGQNKKLVVEKPGQPPPALEKKSSYLEKPKHTPLFQNVTSQLKQKEQQIQQIQKEMAVSNKPPQPSADPGPSDKQQNPGIKTNLSMNSAPFVARKTDNSQSALNMAKTDSHISVSQNSIASEESKDTTQQQAKEPTNKREEKALTKLDKIVINEELKKKRIGQFSSKFVFVKQAQKRYQLNLKPEGAGSQGRQFVHCGMKRPAKAPGLKQQ